MNTIRSIPSEVAFATSVKAVQMRKGSRQAYARMEKAMPGRPTINPDLARIIAAQTNVFLATANAEGQPYIQHRGGPPGFLHLLDDKTIAFPISSATDNTSPSGISPTTQRCICF